MKSRVLYFVFALSFVGIAVIKECDAARILCFFPAGSKSHLIVHSAVAETLAQAGHEVTVMSTLPNFIKKSKYKFIHIDLPSTNEQMIKKNLEKGASMQGVNIVKIMGVMFETTNLTMAHPVTQEFLKSHKENSFDLVILSYMMNDFHLGLAAHFKCPVIFSFMMQPISGLNRIFGNPFESAYVPSLFSSLTQPMNFMERLKNFWFSTLENIIFAQYFDYKMNQLYEHHFPSDRYPPLEEVKNNVSLVFCNHHFSQGPIRPNVPAIIEVGGIQVKEQPDPLPNDIKEILDNATNGAIYFSFGTNVQGSTLSHEKAKIMFDTLSKLPQIVLWKWGDSDFPGESSNIIFRSWLPQDDILAHPNVKLFITHAGQGSVIESQYHGVPMVGIPLFGDQPSNMANVERAGFGVSLEYLTLTEEKFHNAILEVLNNPKYADAVKRFSVLYRDRPMTPRQTLLYWVDYVLRHNGAKHLQSPAVHMNFWQLNSLDVIGFLVSVAAIIVVAFVAICKWLCSCCRGSRPEKSPVSKKKKRN